MKRSQDGASLSFDLEEACDDYTSEAILQAFPKIADEIIRDHSDKALINEALLLAIGTCLHNRSKLNLARKKRLEGLSTALAPFIDELSEIPKAARNAMVLELMQKLLSTADCSDMYNRVVL